MLVFLMIIGAFLGVLALIFASFLYGTAVWAFVIMKCWSWTMVAMFGLTAFTFSQAVAVSLILMILTVRFWMPADEVFLSKEKTDADKTAGWVKMSYHLLIPWVVLGIAWLTKVIFL